MDRPKISWFALHIACLIVGVRAVSTEAADAATVAPVAEDLLGAVPDDVGLCIEARNLHDHLRDFAAGPMFARWKEYPPLAKLYAEQRVQLDRLSLHLKRHFGVSWDDLRSRLFGTQWVLGVYPPAEGKGPPDGFLLIRAADAELLARAAEKLVEANRASERHRGTTSTTIGAATFAIHELKADGDRSVYLTHHGVFGVIATRRDVLDRILKLRGGDRAGALVADPEFIRGFEKLSADCTLRAFLRPRSWLPADPPEIVEGSDVAPNADRLRMLNAGKALTFASAGLSLGAAPRLEAYVGWDAKSLPAPFEAAARCFPASNAASPTIPAAALAAVALNVDLRGVTTAVVDGLSQSYAERGKSLPAEVVVASRLIGALGPGVRGYATRAAKSNDGAARLPVDWVVALDTQSPAEGHVSLAETFDPPARLALVLAADAYNARSPQKARLETLTIDSSSVTGLTNFGPHGIGRVFLMRRAGRLLVGGSPESLRWGVDDRATAVPDAGSQSFAALHDRRFERPAATVFVHVAQIRSLLNDLLTDPPTWLGEPRDDDQARLLELKRLLSLVDGGLLEVAIDAEGAGAALAIGSDERP